MLRPKRLNSHQAERAMEIPLLAGNIFDFGPTPRPLDVAPEHYVDTTPDHTREVDARIEKLLSYLPKPDGFLTGAEVVERMKELIGGGSGTTIMVVDSISPMK